jgi:hypothetical protein
MIWYVSSLVDCSTSVAPQEHPPHPHVGSSFPMLMGMIVIMITFTEQGYLQVEQ